MILFFIEVAKTNNHCFYPFTYILKPYQDDEAIFPVQAVVNYPKAIYKLADLINLS